MFSRKDRINTHLLMLLVLLLWTADSVSSASAVQNLNEVYIIFIKAIFALPAIAAFAMATNRSLALPEKRDVIPILLCSLLVNGMYVFEYAAYKYLSVGMTTVIIGLTPLCCYCVDCIMGTRKVNPIIIVLIIASIIGLAIATDIKNIQKFNIGYLYCFLSIALWTTYGVKIKKYAAKYDLARLTFYEELFTAFAVMPFALALRPQPGTVSVNIIIIVAVVGMLNNGIGYIIENRAVFVLGTPISGLYLNMLPITAATAGFFLLGQSMSQKEIIGSAIVIVSAVAVIFINEKIENKNKCN